MTFQITITCGKGKDSHMYLDIAGGVVACVAWRFWLGALSNKVGRGQRNREEIGAEATWIQEIWVVESGILDFGSRNLESHQGLESGIKVPLTKYPESSTWNPESTVWNPKSKTVLYFLTWGYALGQCFVPCFTYELTQSVLAPNRLSCPIHTVCPGNKHQDRNCDSCCLCL